MFKTVLIMLVSTMANSAVITAMEFDNAALRVEMTDEQCPKEIANGVIPPKIKAEVGDVYTYRVLQNDGTNKSVRTDCYALLYIERSDGTHIDVPVRSYGGKWLFPDSIGK